MIVMRIIMFIFTLNTCHMGCESSHVDLNKLNLKKKRFVSNIDKALFAITSIARKQRPKMTNMQRPQQGT
jgi:hypothetical protein